MSERLAIGAVALLAAAGAVRKRADSRSEEWTQKRGSGASRARVVGKYRLHHITNLRGTYSPLTYEGLRATEEGHKLWEDPMHGRVDTHDKWVLVEFPLSLLNYDGYDVDGPMSLLQDELYRGRDLDPGLAFYDEYDEIYGEYRVELYWGGKRAGAADYRDDETFQVFMPEDHWLRFRNRNSIRSLKGSAAKDACGDCFEANGRYFMDHAVLPGNAKNLRLVHGEVAGQGKLWGTRFGHAWVEDGDDVVDVSMGRDLRLPRVLYYALGHIDQIDNLHKYDVPTFRNRIAEYEHWGPWDLQTTSGL